MEDDDVEDDDVKGESEDDVENDDVEEEEDDTEDVDSDRPQDRIACFVRPSQSKCASTFHKSRFIRKFTGTIPRPRT